MKYQPKSSNQLTSLLVATILCFLGANAFAEGGKAKRMFERADANDDGAISAEEFEAAKDKRGGGHGGKGKRGDRDDG